MIERRPACWIRGNMSPSDYEDDEVRRVTQECPHRRPTGSSLFGPTNECYHPATMSEYVSSESHGNVAIAGGVDGYATFCPAVDLHLTSLGEPSRLYIDAEYEVLDGTPVISAMQQLTVKDDTVAE